MILIHNHTKNHTNPTTTTPHTIPSVTIFIIAMVLVSVVSIYRLLIMNRVKGTCANMYMITNKFVRRNGLYFDSERTMHQNMVVYGRAVAKNIY